MAKNVKLDVNEKGLLTLTSDLSKDFGRSGRDGVGKTVTVGNTGGNVQILNKKGEAIFVNVNIYKYPEEESG